MFVYQLLKSRRAPYEIVRFGLILLLLLLVLESNIFSYKKLSQKPTVAVLFAQNFDFQVSDFNNKVISENLILADNAVF